jgi:hypothetical protein
MGEAGWGLISRIRTLQSNFPSALVLDLNNLFPLFCELYYSGIIILLLWKTEPYRIGKKHNLEIPGYRRKLGSKETNHEKAG